MVMRLRIIHPKADRNLIEEQWIVSMALRAQIVSGLKDELIRAGRELVLGENWRIGSAIRIGHGLGDFFVAVAGHLVERD